MSGIDDIDFGRLGPGFADPVHDAQKSFRAVLDAMAHPGRIVTMSATLPPVPGLSAAAAAVALSLCDADTPMWFDEAAAGAATYLTFHCGAPRVGAPGAASLAFIASPPMMPPLDGFALGSDEYPERSATLILDVPSLIGGDGVSMRGPGIAGEARFAVSGVPERLWAEREALAELFPRGVDLLFTSGHTIAAMPRSTRIVS